MMRIRASTQKPSFSLPLTLLRVANIVTQFEEFFLRPRIRLLLNALPGLPPHSEPSSPSGDRIPVALGLWSPSTGSLSEYKHCPDTLRLRQKITVHILVPLAS